MYHRSREMLIFFIATLLVITIASGVIDTIYTRHLSGGGWAFIVDERLKHTRLMSHINALTLRQRRRFTSECCAAAWELPALTVSCSLDRCQSFPWIETMDHRGLFCSVNIDSRVLLFSVELVIWLWLSVSTKVLHIPAMPQCLASASAYCPLRFWCANLTDMCICPIFTISIELIFRGSSDLLWRSSRSRRC